MLWIMGTKRIEKIRTEEIRPRAGVANKSEQNERSDTEIIRT